MAYLSLQSPALNHTKLAIVESIRRRQEEIKAVKQVNPTNPIWTDARYANR